MQSYIERVGNHFGVSARTALRALACGATLTAVVIAPEVHAQETATGAASSRTTPSRDSGRGPEVQKLASQLVQTLRIRPGQIVVIRGGTVVLPAIEALTMEVSRAGGRVVPLITTDRLARFYAAELPEQFVGGPPHAIDSALVRSADLWIELPRVGDPGVFTRDVSVARQTKADASQPAFAALRASSRARRVFVNLPQPGDTVGLTVGADAYQRMVWAALTADYTQIARTGDALRRAMTGARRVRVTSPEGTDLTVALGDRPVILDVGGADTGMDAAAGSSNAAPPATRQMSLPGGTASVATVEGSANGRIRAAVDNCRQFVRDEAIDLKAGTPTNVRAGSDEACVKEALDSIQFAGITIGLNPGARPATAAEYSQIAFAGAGVVGMAFGNNSAFGGTLTTPRQWIVPLLRATVTVDDRVLVRDGQLVLPTTATSSRASRTP